MLYFGLVLCVLSILFLDLFFKRDSFCLFFIAQISYYLIAAKSYIGKTLVPLEIEGLWIILIGNILAFSFYQLLRTFTKDKWDQIKFNSALPLRTLSWCIVLLSFFSLNYLFTAGLGQWAGVVTGAGHSGLRSLFGLMALMAMPLAVVCFRNRTYFLGLLLVGCSFVSLLDNGSRLGILALWSAPFFYLLHKQGTSKLKKMCVVGLVFLGMLSSHVLARGIRWAPTVEAVGTNISKEIASDVSGGESSIFSYYLMVLEDSKNSGPVGPRTLSRVIFAPIPRFGIMQNFKSQDISYELWSRAIDKGYFGGSTDGYIKIRDAGGRGSVHTLFWGDAIYNFGYLGIIVNAILAAVLGVVISRILNLVMNKDLRLIIFSLTWLMYFCFARGSISNGYNIFLYNLIFLIIFILLSVGKKNLVNFFQNRVNRDA